MKEADMRFIVKPLFDHREWSCGANNITMCALCSEDPRFCGDLI